LPTVTFERHDQGYEDQLDSEVSFVIGQNEAALPEPCRVIVFIQGKNGTCWMA
jgi:hypothetical protein